MKLIRREFLKSIGIYTAGFYVSRMRVIAGPFVFSDFRNGVPADKKLKPEWIKSILGRGNKTVYTKERNELNFIGMPVGGIATGTLYLSGDGRLWLWDIFNENREGIDPKEVEFNGTKVKSRDGSAYVQPPQYKNKLRIEQGFGIKINDGYKTQIKKLNETEWASVRFKGEYPVATVDYTDTSVPVEVGMEAFSPFIPLDSKNSGLPATVFSFTVKNKTSAKVKVELAGWIQNACSLLSVLPADGERHNKTVRTKEYSAVLFSFEKAAPLDKADQHKDLINDDLETAGDYGFMALASLHSKGQAFADFNIETFTGSGKPAEESSEKNIGGITQAAEIDAGASAHFTFVLSWYFPNLKVGITDDKSKRYYARFFKNAKDVIDYICRHKNYLFSNTHAWKNTWYDSSLPYWFLDRTFANTSTLATTTCHRFGTGRFWAWEGVGCCNGTCTHVWQYAQAAGRMFPDIERDTRERVDLGISFDKATGIIKFRGEGSGPAIDGQAGTILRIYREHQMSADYRFLKKNWDTIKKAIDFVIRQDKNKDGMLDTPLENTLDAVWDGEIAWLVGLCIAAVKAGEEMAKEMKDTAFALRCADYVQKGKLNMETNLFNGEYFIHRPDPVKGRKNIGSYNTCHIDQVYGQSWAFQVGLGRILDKEKTRSALRALWKYNFMPDVGPYIAKHPGGRPYALAGDAGMVMNTNPKGEEKPYGENVTWQGGYFHECMSGFEHQVASHLIAEDMVEEGLVLTRAIEDRYHAALRNPYNEIECSDHYARAMASYGSFISICGFQYHGPKGYLAFAPKLNPDNFKAAFTTAAGWGTFWQERKEAAQTHTIQLNFGKLRLKTIAFAVPDLMDIKQATVFLNKDKLVVNTDQESNNITVVLRDEANLKKGDRLRIALS